MPPVIPGRRGSDSDSDSLNISESPGPRARWVYIPPAVPSGAAQGAHHPAAGHAAGSLSDIQAVTETDSESDWPGHDRIISPGTST